MKYHGMYCGPNWSDGKHQTSVSLGRDSVDALDQLCKEHDAIYAHTRNQSILAKADALFAKKALALGYPKAMLAGLVVGAQGRFRATDKPMTKSSVDLFEAQIMKQKKNKPTPASATAPKMNKVAVPSNTAQSTMTAVPSAYVLTSRTNKPKTYATKNGGVILAHRGLVAGFVGSTTFTAKAFQVNPGLGSVFPWCSQLARSYDKYRFRKLKFEFRSVVPTTTAGVVMMSFDYDTLDTLPATKFEHSQTTPNAESNSFHSFELPVQCDNVFRFVRQGAITGVDYKTYDFGQLVISSSYGAAVLLGELYVDYEVELQKPSHGVAVSCNLTQNSPPSVAFCIGTNATMTGNANPISLSASGSAIIFNRPGEYFCTMKFSGTTITAINVPTLIAGYSAGAAVSSYFNTVIDSAAAVGTRSFRCRVGTGDQLEFSAVLTAAAISSTQLAITETEYSP